MFELIDYVKLLNGSEVKEVMESDKEYIFFDLSVSNVGATVRISFSDEFSSEWKKFINSDEWNGYDVVLYTEEIQEMIEKEGIKWK